MITRRTFASSLAFAAPAAAALSEPWSAEKLSAILKPSMPWPAAADRTAWNSLPPEIRQSLLAAGEAHVGKEWPSLPVTVFLEYQRNGNRVNYERIRDARRARLRELALAECVEAKGRFLDDILNGLWLTCEETYWGLPAHLNLQKAGSGLADVEEPTVDLFAAETGAQLSWTSYLLAPQIASLSPLLPRRVEFEVHRRILEPCLNRDDFSWMGLASARPVNNWNPWINSNWLTCALLLDRDPSRRAKAVHKILRSLDRFLDSYHPDGGCDEGPTYWGRAGASLFDCLELLHSASGGAIDFFSLPLVREMGRYIMRVNIAGDWYVNFADAAARLIQNGDLIYRCGRRIGDPQLQQHGVSIVQTHPRTFNDSLLRVLPALFTAAEISRIPPATPPLVAGAWFPGIQIVTARCAAGSTKGLYLAAQGGHNAESHNHNDVGNFIVYSDGLPALIDVGVETYTAQTFSPRRYEIWTMQSRWHNCPTINGVTQKDGRQYAARDVSCIETPERVTFKLDLAAAYPPEAQCRRWTRVLVLDRASNSIDLTDDFELNAPDLPVELNLICAAEPQLLPGRLVLPGRLAVAYDAQSLNPVLDSHPTTDARLHPVWGDQIWRVRLTARKAPRTARWALHITQPGV